jgi:hypothetical protein
MLREGKRPSRLKKRERRKNPNFGAGGTQQKVFLGLVTKTAQVMGKPTKRKKKSLSRTEWGWGERERERKCVMTHNTVKASWSYSYPDNAHVNRSITERERRKKERGKRK